jgi:hypothetical protein
MAGSVSPYKRTTKKVVLNGKSCTVYIRAKDGVECIRRRNKEGKTTYRKISSVSNKRRGGACPCNKMSGGEVNEIVGDAGEIVGDAGEIVGDAGEIVGDANEVLNSSLVEGSYNDATGQDGGAERLEKNKKADLYQKARKYGIKGRSKMSKKELIVAVRSAQRALGERLRRRSKGRKSDS